MYSCIDTNESIMIVTNYCSSNWQYHFIAAKTKRMSDDDQDETLRHQFQQLQNQQQRRLQLLQKRREEKARQGSLETSSVGSGPAFGIADDLDLKVYCDYDAFEIEFNSTHFAAHSGANDD
jgi:hypothetical protein